MLIALNPTLLLTTSVIKSNAGRMMKRLSMDLSRAELSCVLWNANLSNLGSAHCFGDIHNHFFYRCRVKFGTFRHFAQFRMYGFSDCVWRNLVLLL